MDHFEKFPKKTNANVLLEIVYDFYKTMKEKEITLVYEGEVTHQLTKAFTTMTEMNLSKGEEGSSVQKKVYHVMIECLQNISKHAGDLKIGDTISSGRGIFMVSKSDSEYSITSGNAIENSKLESLSSSIDYVNSLNKDELKELYASQIVKGELSDKGGAGLGFIDIARKTGRKLEYSFLKIDDDTSFFILTSFVSRV